MNDRPMLIFPRPVEVDRARRAPGRGGNTHYPSHEAQVSRISPKLRQLEEAISNQRVTVTPNTTGVTPEYAVVFETVGTIDNFVNTVRNIDGLEWLAEMDEFIDADEDFYVLKDGEISDKPLGARLFLIMSNQTAIRELKNLWDKYRNQVDFERGTTKWRDLFAQLKDLRLWSVEDRFYKTGLKEILEGKKLFGVESIRFEIELWYREEDGKRIDSSSKIKQLVRDAGGTVLTESIISAISYHAILVEAPISIFDNLSEESSIQLIKADSVMFFRPVGQSAVIIPSEIEVEEYNYDHETGSIDIEEKHPVIALLDGLPLQNHDLLRDKIIIDDPDGFESDYEASKRFHGTTMASLIVHGELDAQETPLSRKIYVRPIMKPNPNDFMGNSEFIPDDILPVDLVHRAVKRMFEGEGVEEPSAPYIKVINLSIGDPSRPFDLQLSPWAKLIDYLSNKYRVLFLISAGNYPAPIVLDIPRDDFSRFLGTPTLAEKVIKSISGGVLDRRILSPSESINSLCIGASHKDSSVIQTMGTRFDVFNNDEVMSTYSRVGLGYRNSIKPDLLLPGGKQLFTENVMGSNGLALLDVNNAPFAPGHKVAFPGNHGRTNEVTFTRGTSNATALASKFAGEIYELLDILLSELPEKEEILKEYGALFIKTLLVHGAHWNGAYQYYKNILQLPGETKFRDKKLPRYIGYGFVSKDKILNANEQKVTLIGYSTIRKEDGQLFEVPLPPSLSSNLVKRRLTITLSWFSPLNKSNQKYRKAHLWFDSENSVLQLNRLETDAKAVQRGTVQHEIFEGDRAAAFVDGDVLKIKVNCKQDATGLGAREEITYTIAVTLEVADGVNLPIYTEVRDRTRVDVRTRIQ